MSKLELQPASLDTWDKKYRLKDESGISIDVTVEDTFARVAKELASVEKPQNQSIWEQKFLYALLNGATPAGRILSNAGAQEYKPATSTINCTVSGTIEDSMDSILDHVKEAGMTLKAGCGIGYEFSTLRPKGAFVKGAGAKTSGPLSFMDIYDAMCFTVSSAGGRRGAQMGTFDISHPDVVEFIRAKREDGRLRQFNLSLLITDEFIHAVRRKGDWDLVWDGKVVETVKAVDLWDLIMESTYDYAEPGFILIDEVNRMNNNWFCENIRATNPCGEQPLPPHGSCLLGSINLTNFIVNPFTPDSRFDYDKFREVTRIFTRMLDNVVDINGLPLPEQRAEILRKRRHGMGILGLGSAITMMGFRYGDENSLRFTESVTRNLAVNGTLYGIELAQEKGAAPIMEEDFEVTADIVEFLRDPLLKEELVTAKGKDLWVNSKYMERIWDLHPNMKAEALEFGCRFTHHSSIAPTGTIALSINNNVSNGIEPSFSHSYNRNIIVDGKATKEMVEVQSYESLLYHSMYGADAELPDTFVTAQDIPMKAHVDIQAEAQYWIDSSISKTINIPTETSFEDFESIYMYAWERGLKGCTTFRFNPEVFQGVLVTDKDLQSTYYTFTSEDGEEITLRGDEEVEYGNEVHTAGNLYDAIKEGYYGKF